MAYENPDGTNRLEAQTQNARIPKSYWVCAQNSELKAPSLGQAPHVQVLDLYIVCCSRCLKNFRLDDATNMPSATIGKFENCDPHQIDRY